jgi:acyl-CoA thioesterase-1
MRLTFVNPRNPTIYCSAAAVAASVSCGSATAPTTTPSTVTASTSSSGGHIVVLGDSLAVSPSRSQNFTTELQARLDAAHPGWTIANGGVSGDTTTGGVARTDYWLGGNPEVLILELGGNDGLRGVSTSVVEKNLATIIERAQARGARVLLCGMEAPPLKSWDYSIEFHKIYPRVAAKYGVPLVPFLLEGVALNPDLNGDDIIHPNAAGAKVIAGTVWPYLEPLVASVKAR